MKLCPSKIPTLERKLKFPKVDCALINDAWNHGIFKIEAFASRFVESPNGPDAVGLRVLRYVQQKNKGRRSTIMLLPDNDNSPSMATATAFKRARAVFVPFLGLEILENIRYLDLANNVRRGDGSVLDQELMHMVWRGVVFNLFYFETEEIKRAKLVEEDWPSAEPQAARTLSSSRKRKSEDELSTRSHDTLRVATENETLGSIEGKTEMETC